LGSLDVGQSIDVDWIVLPSVGNVVFSVHGLRSFGFRTRDVFFVYLLREYKCLKNDCAPVRQFIR